MHANLQTNAPSHHAAQPTDANLHQRTVMTTTNVLLTLANQPLDVSTLQSHAMIMMHVPLITAAQSKDALTRQLIAMTRTHVLKIHVSADNVSMNQSPVMTATHVLMTAANQPLDADMFQKSSRTLMHVPLELVMQLKELLIPQEFAKMETNVLLTTVMLKRDVKPLLNLSVKAAVQNLLDVTETNCA
jgi:hypothetical protein